jgi:hypothetical protein
MKSLLAPEWSWHPVHTLLHNSLGMALDIGEFDDSYFYELMFKPFQEYGSE